MGRRFAAIGMGVVCAAVLGTGVASASSWVIQSTPNPTDSRGSVLRGVSCPSTTACTAVGGYTNSSRGAVTLAARWNGSGWALESTPNPTGASLIVMRAISCPSSTACTAVGEYFNSAGARVTLAERWNGSSWAIQSTPNPTGSQDSVLYGVSCPSTTACIAVGSNDLAERWNGSRWAIQSTPNPTGALSTILYGVSCPSTTACTAAGEYFNGSTEVTLAERWNGSRWAIQSTPNPTGGQRNILWGISCPSTTACTAAGSYDNSSGYAVPLAERWNGSSWAIQSSPTPNPGGDSLLFGVSCPSITACTAAGFYLNDSGVDVTLAERWNGSSWAIQSTPNPTGARSNILYGVSCPSTTACTAVGDYKSSRLIKTLAEHS